MLYSCPSADTKLGFSRSSEREERGRAESGSLLKKSTLRRIIDTASENFLALSGPSPAPAENRNASKNSPGSPLIPLC